MPPNFDDPKLNATLNWSCITSDVSALYDAAPGEPMKVRARGRPPSPDVPLWPFRPLEVPPPPPPPWPVLPHWDELPSRGGGNNRSPTRSDPSEYLQYSRIATHRFVSTTTSLPLGVMRISPGFRPFLTCGLDSTSSAESTTTSTSSIALLLSSCLPDLIVL